MKISEEDEEGSKPSLETEAGTKNKGKNKITKEEKMVQKRKKEVLSSVQFYLLNPPHKNCAKKYVFPVKNP